MNSIDGYFGLELSNSYKHYHTGAKALKTGRNALEYVLRVNNYNSILYL
jgi:hypothetical protein